MKEFKSIQDYVKNIQVHDQNLSFTKEKILQELEIFEEKISNFKTEAKNSNKNYRLDSFKSKPLSQLPHIFSKSLYRKEIIIKEKETQKEFKVRVSDYCSDDQKGVIVSFKESDNDRLTGLIRKYELHKEESIYGHKKNFRGGDFRNIFPYGKDWLFVGIAESDFQ